MYRNTHSIFFIALVFISSAGALLMTGCSNNQAPTESAEAPGGRMAGPGGGPGDRGGRMGGPGGGPGGGPVLASATSAEIFQQKCQGCHGANGEGRMGPNLTKKAGAPDDALYKVIHDGEGKMPAFGNQMTEAQIHQLVTYVKGLGKA